MPKYNNKLCDDEMTFEDCELAILRHAVDEAEETTKKRDIKDPNIKTIIQILEEFLVKKKLVCYGGTAINNILPKEAQFYDRDVEIPDYDFYSPNALDDAIELADLYYKHGYQEVEAKAGVHFGTFKVFVNFIPIADITYLPKPLFDNVHKEAISIAGILYAPPNFLRMNMYLELSRPAGDVSRWEKVLKRLTLLNRFYNPMRQYKCSTIDFQRQLDDIDPIKESALQERIYFTVRDTLIDQGVVFFGGYASSLYGEYMPRNERRVVRKVPDFDVLSEDPVRTTTIVQERLQDIGIKKVMVTKQEGIGEIIPPHWEISIGGDILGHVYEPIACHSYNEIHIGGKTVRIATIDTMLTFFLAFIYSGIEYHDKDRIMCMVEYLYKVQERNRLEQKGILKRYSIKCLGKQATLDEIRTEKAEKFKELMNKKDSREYKMWFLKYNPAMKNTKKTKKQTKKSSSTTKNKTTKKLTKKSDDDWIRLGSL
jgi:Poly(A) polymerase catalytic subunit